jgi:hypothetical protein
MPLQPNRYGDTLPSMLTPGEVVLGPREARQLRRPLLDVLGDRVGQATVGGRDDKFDEFGRRSFGLGDPGDFGEFADDEAGYSQIGQGQEDFFHDEEYGGPYGGYSDGYDGDVPFPPSITQPRRAEALPSRQSLPERNLLQALTRRQQAAGNPGNLTPDEWSAITGYHRSAFLPALPALPVERPNAPSSWRERKPTVTSSPLQAPTPASEEVSPKQFLADALAGKGDRRFNQPYDWIFDSIATEASREAVSRARAQGKDAGPRVGIRYFDVAPPRPVDDEMYGGRSQDKVSFDGTRDFGPASMMDPQMQRTWDDPGLDYQADYFGRPQGQLGTIGLGSQLPGPGQVGLGDIEDNVLNRDAGKFAQVSFLDALKNAIQGKVDKTKSAVQNPGGFLSNLSMKDVFSEIFQGAATSFLPPGVGFAGQALFAGAELARQNNLDNIARDNGFKSMAEFEKTYPAGAGQAIADYDARNATSFEPHEGNDDQPAPLVPQRLVQPAPIGPSADPLADLLATITGNTVNPFGDTEEGNLEFSNVMQSGIDRLFSSLGPNPNEQLVNATFNRPNVGDIILGQERGIRQGGFRDVLGEAFTGNAFGNIDDNIINSIVDERAGGQRNIFAGQQARGNFSPAGVLAANEDLLSQTPGATERVREVGQNVAQSSQGDINALRDLGTQRIQDFTLGQPDIDFSDLISQREGLIGERQGSFGSDIRSTLGSEPLFDINQSLLSGGRSQGVVSGQQPNTLLDTIAERERRGTTTDRRGLGTRGSGAF